MSWQHKVDKSTSAKRKKGDMLGGKKQKQNMLYSLCTLKKMYAVNSLIEFTAALLTTFLSFIGVIMSVPLFPFTPSEPQQVLQKHKPTSS